MWEAPKARNELFLRGLAVILTAFVLTGLIYLGVQRLSGYASKRIIPAIAPHYQQEATGDSTSTNDQLPSSPTGASGTTVAHATYSTTPVRYAPLNAPIAPGYVATSGVTYFPPAAPSAPISVSALTTQAGSVFPVESQRQAAAATLEPLREFMTTVKRYDSTQLWSKAPAVAQGGLARLDGSEDGGEIAMDATQRQREFVERVLGETESLSTELALAAHPDRYPAPLRNGIGEIGREARIYLATVQLAAAHPEQRENLHALASQHLAKAQEAMEAMEAMVTTGNASVAN